MKQKISITIDKKTLRGVDSLVDGLIIKNRSQSIEFIVNKILGEKKNAVIFANGLHHRVKKDHFRILGKVNKETVIEFVIRKLRTYNFRNIYMVGEKELLSNIFKFLGNGSEYGVEIKYIQENGAEGSQERLRLLRGIVKTTFLLVPAENLFNINLDKFLKFHLSNKGVATLAVVSNPEPRKFGNVIMEGTKIIDFEQKPWKIKSHIVSTGIMMAEPEILEYSGMWLEQHVFKKLIEKNLLFGFPTSSYWFDVHTKKDLIKRENF